MSWCANHQAEKSSPVFLQQGNSEDVSNVNDSEIKVNQMFEMYWMVFLPCILLLFVQEGNNKKKKQFFIEFTYFVNVNGGTLFTLIQLYIIALQI